MEKFGVHFNCDLKMRSVGALGGGWGGSVFVFLTLQVCVCFRGFYPKGGGELLVTVNPVKELQPVTMTDRGNIIKIHGRAFVAGVLPFRVTSTRTQTVSSLANI